LIAWVQNADSAVVDYWLERGRTDMSGGLAEYTFGVKAYQALRWDTRRVYVGFPRASAWHSADALFAAGVVGLYAERF
jgi:hypothetical protein